jgi:hypothetical protein
LLAFKNSPEGKISLGEFEVVEVLAFKNSPEGKISLGEFEVFFLFSGTIFSSLGGFLGMPSDY